MVQHTPIFIPPVRMYTTQCHAAILNCEGIIHTVGVSEIACNLGGFRRHLPPQVVIQKHNNNLQDQEGDAVAIAIACVIRV